MTAPWTCRRPVDVPEGKRLFEYEREDGRTIRFLADAEPVFTEEDVADVLLTTSGDTPVGRPLREVGAVLVVFRGGLPRSDGEPSTLLLLNGDVVPATIAEPPVAGLTGVRPNALTAAQREAILTYFRWGEAPEALPGTGTIRVTARFPDGSKPMPADCRIWPDDHDLDGAGEPKVVGADGDWVIYSVPPGEWKIGVFGPGFPDELPGYQRLSVDSDWEWKLNVEVTPGSAHEIEVTLSRGGTVVGRVITPEGREILETHSVKWSLGVDGAARVEPDGSYRLEHVRAGEGYVFSFSSMRYVNARTPDFTVVEGETVTAPPINLRVGGWIVGSADLPASPDGGRVWAWVKPVAETELPEDVLLGSYRVGPGGKFKAGPLFPGRYRLEVGVEVGPFARGEPQWSGETESVTVQAGKTADVGHVELSPTGG